jgi:2-keto-3-deoxy-L-rhamnonate aldolase RhmA
LYTTISLFFYYVFTQMRAKVAMLIKNRTKQLLSEGRLAFSFGVSRSRTMDIAALARACGYDWLFIDMEHNAMDVDRAADLCATALHVGISPIVRVPGHEHYHATRLLDAGAQGVIFPHIDTADQARAIARSCKYPPEGNRSISAPMPQLDFESIHPRIASEMLNAEILIVAMIETGTAVDNAADIAAVPGIDVLLVGTTDLSADLGIVGSFGDPRIEACYRAVIDAAHRHGKTPGMGGVYDHALMRKYINMGARFVLGGSDVSFLMTAAKERAAFLREVETALDTPASAIAQVQGA